MAFPGPGKEKPLSFTEKLIACTGSKKALQAAKYNVERHYDVVGVLDDILGFIRVLETTLPFYFDGATEKYSTCFTIAFIICNISKCFIAGTPQPRVCI